MSHGEDTSAPGSTTQPTRNSFLGCLIAAVAVLVIGFVLLGGVYVAEIPFRLVLGWGFYLFRVLPEVRVSGAGIATFVITLALLAAGVHVAAQWWLQRGRPDDEAPPWTPGQTARLVCLVCLAFAAAIGITGVVHQTGWLLNSPEPIVASTFTAHLRVGSRDNLHNMGSAFLDEFDATNQISNGIISPDGRVLHSWQTALLPHMGQASIANVVDYDRPWHDPRNRAVMQQAVPPFLNPGVRDHDHMATGYGATHYAANLQVIHIDRRIGLDEITDGVSSTILAGEVNSNFRAWGDPLNLRDPALGINKSDDGFGGPFTGGSHFLLADGEVQFINENIDPSVLRALSTPNAGDQVEPF